MTCPKCNGQMEEGYVLDHTGGFSLKQEWWDGKQGWFFGLLKNTRKVMSYRCEACGYLESYTKDKTFNL